MIPKRTDARKFEVTQPQNSRDAVRARAIARIPDWYRPSIHVAFPSAVGIGLVVAAAWLLERPTATELATIPLFLVVVNFIEWHVHRNVLHRRTWPLEELYRRHTPEHHVIFVRDDMAMRSRREFRLVLIPFYGILAIFVSEFPVTALLWYGVSPNVALLWVACTMGYTVSYEWLHLAYHLPHESRVGRSPLIRWLRRHHAHHHTPELMQRWNFNVTIPFADWVLRTIHPETNRA